jgi:hypothetical protein
MEKTKRATIYLDADVHCALRLRAAACIRSISDIVYDTVRMTLAEDADYLTDAGFRAAEQSSSFEDFVTSPKDSGRILFHN